ncbi:MAG: response regulator transcription factor, partial [Actinomycetota bacterium]|nr:response regulator transcription factor [Actinomycetota bacterium]
FAAFAAAKLPAELAAVRLDLARALASDRPEVAIAEASAAYDVYDRLKAAREADAAAALLRSLGVRKPGRRSDALLTDREEEVLALVAEGLANAEIAERLYLSRKTVEHHVTRVLTKLGVRNRTEAARWATTRRGGDSGRE